MATSSARKAKGGGGATGRKTFEIARQAIDSAARHGRGLRIVIGEGAAGSSDVQLPAELVEVMVQALDHLTRGQSVSVVPTMAEMTTQEAADLLGISRPTMVKLLTEGRIPYRKVGARRRVRLEDVMAWRNAEEARREAVLDELAAEAQRLGLGYQG